MWTRLEKRNGGPPLYKQLITHIERAIESGRLTGGERLPSERRLCALLGVNRSTVIHALADLSDRGILLRRRGSGAWVNHEKWGLQQYPLLNWRPPSTRCGTENGEDAAGIVLRRQEARHRGECLWDLAGGDLAADLLPQAVMPEQSWQELLGQELDAVSSVMGLAAFRETVRHHLRRTLGLNASQDEILITTGAQQALFLITQCLLRPGDAVGIEAPSYCYSLPLFQAAGLRLFAIPMDEEGVEPEGLDLVASRRGLKMIFLNPAFQNPTGRPMSLQRKEAVLRYCSTRRIPIVEDDAYSLLAFDGKPASPIKNLDRRGQTLYIGSLSSYMGRNIRAGWLLAPPGVIRKLAGVRGQIDSGPSVLPQLVAGHYLETAEREHRMRLQATLARRAAALEERLAPLADMFRWDRPRGGFYLYLRAREGSRDKGEPDPLDALLNLGIIPAPGGEYGDSQQAFRLNYAQAPV